MFHRVILYLLRSLVKHADASATIYLFNVPLHDVAKRRCAELGVRVQQYNVIYHLIDGLKASISEILPLQHQEVRHGMLCR